MIIVVFLFPFNNVVDQVEELDRMITEMAGFTKSINRLSIGNDQRTSCVICLFLEHLSSVDKHIHVKSMPKSLVF